MVIYARVVESTLQDITVEIRESHHEALEAHASTPQWDERASRVHHLDIVHDECYSLHKEVRQEGPVIQSAPEVSTTTRD
jgi:hypothetical protein